MPQQLIYTSAPRGLTPGRSGYCTVARSVEVREALVVQLEQFSYYHHQSLTGGIERPVHAFRVLDIRGTRYFVLSRIQDAGLDFTKRTNFLAHHLVFTPEEIAALASPPLLFLHWDGWKPSWDGEPELLAREDWGNLHTIKGFESDPVRHYETAPARCWEQWTGAAVNAFGLLDLRGSAWLAANKESDEVPLRLLAESLRMLELRNRDVDFRAKAWEFTFTTNFQEQDNPNDFRWRCVHTEALSAGKRQAETLPLHEVRSKKHSAEESDFATIGPHPAVIVKAPTEVTVNEGQDANLKVDARGVPYPDVEWYWNGNLLTQFSNSECVISNLKPGSGQFCEVRVRNAYGQDSARVKVHVNQAPKPTTPDKVATFRWDGPDPNEANTPQLVSLVQFYKKESRKLWECIRILDENEKHKALLNVGRGELKTLYEFCSTQKEFSAQRIAARCARKLGRWFIITTFVRSNFWISMVGLVLLLLSMGILMWKSWPSIARVFDSKPKQIEKSDTLQNQGGKDNTPKGKQ